jgi:hypothetical protein
LVDKPYFAYNEFKDFLAKAGLEDVGKLTKSEWNVMRKAMGKPRRFSANFVKAEKNRLK